MLSKTPLYALIFALFCGHSIAASFPVKTIIRGNTLFMQSSSGENYTKIIAPDFNLLVHLNDKFALGTGIDLYYSGSNLDFWGLKLFGRRYFHGAGIQKEVKTKTMDAKTLEKMAFYWGGEFKRYTYSLGTNKSLVEDYELEGNFYNINANIGVDYRLGHNFEINAELGYTLLALTATDNRIKARSLIFGVGIGYLW